MRYRATLAIPVLLLCSAGAMAQLRAITFDGIDADRNGGLSKEEVAKFFGNRQNRQNEAPKLFARWDANGAGKVSKREFDNRPQPGPPPVPRGTAQPPAR